MKESDDDRCWDGKNLDTPNHKDHVSHPVGGPTSFAVVTGECPSSHPVKIPQIMLEVCNELSHRLPFLSRLTEKQVAWDTRAFNNPADWPEDGSQPFYLSNGDQ